MIKTRQELIKKYIHFFINKRHKEIPSASLIPENDPTVLFTTAGMHPLVPFLTGERHSLGKRLVNVQRCIRTGDIDDIGDEVHHTFFEMLGNWSLGDYWKEGAINYNFEFITRILKIPIEKLAVTVFAGNENAGRDEESAKIWKSLGILKERIAYLIEDNWWGPAGETGPCGPCTEMFYWTGKTKAPKKFDPEDKNWVEIGNDVLMQYEKTKEGKFIPLKQKNVDFGGGVERTLAILNGFNDNYKTTVFEPIIKEIEKISGKKYGKDKEETRAMRIIADHIRAAVFILGDVRAIKPSNVGQGYILRRLIRRAIRYGKILEIKGNFTVKVAHAVFSVYPDYQELHRNHNFILTELDEEENKFNSTLEKGIKKFNEIIGSRKEKMSQQGTLRVSSASEEMRQQRILTGQEAFLLFQSYGFPIEFTEELAEEKGIKVDLEEYNEEFKRHQDLSRTASSGQFKSGLADDSEETRKLHTATHLLNEALRIVLNDQNIKQKGSNINPERLRFDFSFPRKLEKKELERIEKLVNELIQRGLKVEREEIPLQDALQSGAQAEFGAKYPELVSVYTVYDPRDKRGWFSKEICTGPHVTNTKEIGKFKIIKEESVSAGVRRIKAVVE